MDEEVQMWKLGCFLGYNALALYSMNKYVRNFVATRKAAAIKTSLSAPQIRRKYGFDKVMKKGSIYGLMMGGLYISGLMLVGYYTLSVQTYKKYC